MRALQPEAAMKIKNAGIGAEGGAAASRDSTTRFLASIQPT
jgi:hypothetical protein